MGFPTFGMNVPIESSCFEKIAYTIFYRVLPILCPKRLRQLKVLINIELQKVPVLVRKRRNRTKNEISGKDVPKRLGK